MIKRTRNKLPDAKLNDLVVLHVIEVDRGPTDPAIKINAIKITNITSSTILENMGEVLKKYWNKRSCSVTLDRYRPRVSAL